MEINEIDENSIVYLTNKIMDIVRLTGNNRTTLQFKEVDNLDKYISKLKMVGHEDIIKNEALACAKYDNKIIIASDKPIYLSDAEKEYLVI